MQDFALKRPWWFVDVVFIHVSAEFKLNYNFYSLVASQVYICTFQVSFETLSENRNCICIPVLYY